MRGTYAIIMELISDKRISVGKLGKINFKKGYYLYVGSGQNSLETRIARHLKKRKKKFWHIDYLLSTFSPTPKEKDEKQKLQNQRQYT